MCQQGAATQGGMGPQGQGQGPYGQGGMFRPQSQYGGLFGSPGAAMGPQPYQPPFDPAAQGQGVSAPGGMSSPASFNNAFGRPGGGFNPMTPPTGYLPNGGPGDMQAPAYMGDSSGATIGGGTMGAGTMVNPGSLPQQHFDPSQIQQAPWQQGGRSMGFMPQAGGATGGGMGLMSGGLLGQAPAGMGRGMGSQGGMSTGGNFAPTGGNSGAWGQFFGGQQAQAQANPWARGAGGMSPLWTVPPGGGPQPGPPPPPPGYFPPPPGSPPPPPGGGGGPPPGLLPGLNQQSIQAGDRGGYNSAQYQQNLAGAGSQEALNRLINTYNPGGGTMGLSDRPYNPSLDERFATDPNANLSAYGLRWNGTRWSK